VLVLVATVVVTVAVVMEAVAAKNNMYKHTAPSTTADDVGNDE
jgi:hypothetical protein